MSRKPCSRHGFRINGKLASFYWAWFRSDDQRVAVKEMICPDCARAELAKVLSHANDDSNALALCPACGTNSEADLDPIFLSLYLPKQDPRAIELATCAPCAARLRIRIMEGGEPLPDRRGEDGGPRPSTPDPWTDF